MKWQSVATSWNRVNNANCGTGAGGFKKGNTCASSNDNQLQHDSIDTLSKQLSLPPMKTIGGNLYSSGKVNEPTEKVVKRVDKLVKTLQKHGFIKDMIHVKPPYGSGINEWYHPNGHFVEIYGGHRNSEPNSFEVFVYMIPREIREGVIISRTALESSYAPSKQVNRATILAAAAYKVGLEGNKSKAMKLHADTITLHQEAIDLLESNLAKFKRKKRASKDESKSLAIAKDIKHHVNAITNHMVAKDWYEEHMTNNRRWVSIK